MPQSVRKTALGGRKMFERAYAVSSISAFRESLHDNMLALRSEGRE